MKTISKVRRPQATKSYLSQSIQPINAEAAKHLANRFILENLPDRFCAGTPRIGAVGQTGVIAVDVETRSVTGWTPLREMKKAAKDIYEEKKAEIEAAFF